MRSIRRDVGKRLGRVRGPVRNFCEILATIGRPIEIDPPHYDVVCVDWADPKLVGVKALRIVVRGRRDFCPCHAAIDRLVQFALVLIDRGIDNIWSGFGIFHAGVNFRGTARNELRLSPTCAAIGGVRNGSVNPSAQHFRLTVWINLNVVCWHSGRLSPSRTAIIAQEKTSARAGKHQVGCRGMCCHTRYVLPVRYRCRRHGGQQPAKRVAGVGRFVNTHRQRGLGVSTPGGEIDNVGIEPVDGN